MQATLFIGLSEPNIRAWEGQCEVYVMLLGAPSLHESMGLHWSRSLRGSLKRPLCVSFKARLCFVSLALCKGAEYQLPAAGQAGPQAL